MNTSTSHFSRCEMRGMKIMEMFFIKGFLQDSYLGINGIWDSFDKFLLELNLSEGIERVQDLCKSIEDWTLKVRLENYRSPFIYGLSGRDIIRKDFNEQVQLLQHYLNIYTLLLHISNSTLINLREDYNEKIDWNKVNQIQGEEVKLYDYIEKCNRECKLKYGRELL